MTHEIPNVPSKKAKEQANERYQEAVASFIRDFNAGKVQKLEVVGNRNQGIFEYQGKIIKLLQPRRMPKPEDLRTLKERVHDMPNVFVPQLEFTVSETLGGVVMEKAPGIDAETLTPEQIDLITDEQWVQFETTMRELSQRGVWVDLTKKSNFFYDENSGFSFIDLENDSTKGGKKEKFFFKGDQECYYPFERYPFFPVPYTTSKALFTNIAAPPSASSPEDTSRYV